MRGWLVCGSLAPVSRVLLSLMMEVYELYGVVVVAERQNNCVRRTIATIGLPCNWAPNTIGADIWLCLFLTARLGGYINNSNHEINSVNPPP